MVGAIDDSKDSKGEMTPERLLEPVPALEAQRNSLQDHALTIRRFVGERDTFRGSIMANGDAAASAATAAAISLSRRLATDS